MQKFLKIIVILFGLLIVAVAAVPFIVPLDTYKNKIIEQVKEKTGRDLIIEGDVKASIFPVLGIKIGKASLSNPKGYKAGNMVQADGLTVAIDFSALLQKKLKIKQFILSKPLVNLEINGSGRPNWDFAGAANASKNNGSPKQKSTSGEEALFASLMLGDVKIIDGEINYLDNQTKRDIALTALNVKASLPDIAQQFMIDGSAMWNGERVSVNATVARPDKLIAGDKTAFEISLKSAHVTLNYGGEVAKTSLAGDVVLHVPSILSLASWTGNNFDWQGAAPLAFTVRGRLDSTATAAELSKAEIILDDINFKGDVKAELDKKTPLINVNLTSGMLNLNPYLKQPKIRTSWLIGTAIAEEYSSQPIDLAALKSADAKVVLTIGNIVYEKIKLGKTIIRADVENGVLKLVVPEMALYDGSAEVAATLDSTGKFTKQVKVSNVNVGDLLGDAAAQSRFSGLMNASASLNGRLTSVQGAVKSLAGKGEIKITDGAIKGIDLKNMVNNVQAAFANTESSAQQTAFSELGGTFTISGGIISNKDLSLKSQLLALSGKGTVNLPMQTIQYRLNPEILSTVKRGDGSATKGLEVPIIVDGPLSDPRFVPDVAGMVKGALENPNALKNTVKSIKEQFESGKPDIGQVQDLLKGFGQQ